MAESALASEAMLTVDQRAAIGTVAVETTYLEFAIERLIQRLLGIAEHAQAGLLTDRLGLTQELDALHELGHATLSDDTQRAEWSAYISNLRNVGRQAESSSTGSGCFLSHHVSTPIRSQAR
jgi:hypothetical protein